ncbi:hypothetical protein DHEL01_v202313 [Diaporthe helianthi]|uniref:Uncharacterized protein n=1 Tax=Diaporthe helianthi TaxID=158607 RepID=A0A2P5I9X1_DIAHE|nr:hypothetical protein DHEL01_v202313 [Diaporthe helianthi]
MLLDQARSIGGGEEIFTRIDGWTLEVLGVIIARIQTCFGPPSRLDDKSVETMLAGSTTYRQEIRDTTRQEDPFDTEGDEESNAEDEFSNLCRLYSSNEPTTSLWVARRGLMTIRRDLAIFEVLRAKRLTTQFQRKWNGAVLADGSNIGQLFDMVPEPVPEGFQKLYLSISTHLEEKQAS